MQTFELRLSHPIGKTYRCQRAADSLDIDARKKSVHELKVDADIETPFNVGLIVGASGSGKTTLAKHIWPEQMIGFDLIPELPIIDQFPKEMGFDDCANLLCGVGLTQVPCWIRPVSTLSTGQRVRAEIALRMAATKKGDFIIVDEWTSVVDRTVGKIMSHCINKFARRIDVKIVLLSCHYDVIEWLDPDWIIDCNAQSFSDRRFLRRSRKEKLHFAIREVGRESWPFFSKYHYLSQELPGGLNHFFGIFHGPNQIGFICYSPYMPVNSDPRKRPKKDRFRRRMIHANRLVIHPDYCGFGLGIKFLTKTAAVMKGKGYDVRTKFSSLPVMKAVEADPSWVLLKKERNHKYTIGKSFQRNTGFRLNVSTASFKFIGEAHEIRDDGIDSLRGESEISRSVPVH